MSAEEALDLQKKKSALNQFYRTLSQANKNSSSMSRDEEITGKRDAGEKVVVSITIFISLTFLLKFCLLVQFLWFLSDILCCLASWTLLPQYIELEIELGLLILVCGELNINCRMYILCEGKSILSFSNLDVV